MPIQAKKENPYPIKDAVDILGLVVSEKEIVFADIESTGFGDYDDITEIGAVRVDVDSGKVISKFSTFIKLKTQKRVPKKIEELTGITTEMLTDAPILEDVLQRFRSFIGNSVLVFHNARFDWRMLQVKYALIGQTLTNEVICSMKLFRYLHPKQKATLDAVTTYYGNPIIGHHRAYVDSKWTAACYRKMREEVITLYDSEQLPIGGKDYPTQHNDRVVISTETLKENCTIFRISGWKKDSRSRIYCSTNYADIYYDVVGHVWNVSKKKTPLDLDVDALAKFILSNIGMHIEEFEARYAVV